MQQPQGVDAGSNYNSKMGQKTIVRVRANAKAVERQEKIFTNWINFILRQRGLQISSVLSDLDDGLILIQLAEILIGKTVAAYERNPKLMAQRLSNISIALKFFSDNHVRCTVGPKCTNDEKTILGFIWLLIRQFQLKSSTDSVAAGRLSSARDEDLDVLERELRRAMEAAQQKPAEQPAAPPAAAVAVVDSEKKVQRERTKEKPVIKDGTHSTVVSESLKGTKFRVKQAQLEDRCSKCSQLISDETMIQVDSGANYHMSCFTCSACSAAFDDVYWEHDGKALCEKHYLQTAGKECVKCSELISGPLVKAMHQNWHYSCFVCTTCQKPFEGDYCTISNAPYCKQDYYRKKGWLCAKCDKVVGKGDKSALGKAWHKGCFVCTTCDQPFGSAGFFNLGGRPYCPVHYREKNTAAGLTASGSRPAVTATSSN
ncbi:uncharacterized protein ACA1_061640 [Acanthamoeba castellanii str. Neff]|uniref:LIM domain containing protein n=1 Tax=Acanthamoeba castellanii (strain ATCC 30010 / Neff) TaxID=1257118 RepID=L8GW18_ACACF|nr:uncharacterized protein ACA1_061640 [Acanthamoeba castellanii str. Neff]ELR17424.1 hypothetical protein ACA1_061640 [Acanthamoeba castellanii str. Neff]